jgi:hypothetical protein
LRTWDTLLAYIRGTTTTTGWKVDAFRHDGCYETGRSVAHEDLDALNLQRHSICPNWNYTNLAAMPGVLRTGLRTFDEKGTLGLE